MYLLQLPEQRLSSFGIGAHGTNLGGGGRLSAGAKDVGASIAI
jgi:hypothetical protein